MVFFAELLKTIFKHVVKSSSIAACKIFYPKCQWLLSWNPYIVWKYAFFQKLLNINGARHIAWPVHFTSTVSGSISLGSMCAPGLMPGAYINGMNGIEFGENVFIGPAVKIISANHNQSDYRKHDINPNLKIRIGSNTWIGANVVILPKAIIGENCIIGAGSVVTKEIPSNSIAAGNPARVISQKK